MNPSYDSRNGTVVSFVVFRQGLKVFCCMFITTNFITRTVLTNCSQRMPCSITCSPPDHVLSNPHLPISYRTFVAPYVYHALNIQSSPFALSRFFVLFWPLDSFILDYGPSRTQTDYSNHSIGNSQYSFTQQCNMALYFYVDLCSRLFFIFHYVPSQTQTDYTNHSIGNEQ